MPGLIHIYTGEGKGKTTCSVGLAVRAAANDMNVLYTQFMKLKKSGEVSLIETIPNVTVLKIEQGGGFSFLMSEEEKEITRNEHNKLIDKITKLVGEGKVDLLIMDEIISAYNNDLLDCKKVDNFVLNKPEELELVMTGRNAPQHLVDVADYVSDIQKVKHPFDRGISGREGIER